MTGERIYLGSGSVSRATPLPVRGGAKEVVTLLDAATTIQKSQAVAIPAGNRTVRASIAGTGAVSATIDWYGDHTESNSGGVYFGTSNLSGTTTAVTGGTPDEEWPFVYADLTEISGAGAAVSVSVAY